MDFDDGFLWNVGRESGHAPSANGWNERVYAVSNQAQVNQFVKARRQIRGPRFKRHRTIGWPIGDDPAIEQ